MGMETSFFWFGVFSGSFGVRSIVLLSVQVMYLLDKISYSQIAKSVI